MTWTHQGETTIDETIMATSGTRSKVLLILGGGPRIGHAVAKRFLEDGYRVAIGRRHPGDAKDPEQLKEILHVTVDVARRESVESAFNEVKAKLGVPNVVVYNGKNAPKTSRSASVSVSPH